MIISVHIYTIKTRKGGIYMKSSKKENQGILTPECDVVELSEQDMEKAIGGASAFSNIPRVKNHDYDDEIRDKI